MEYPPSFRAQTLQKIEGGVAEVAAGGYFVAGRFGQRLHGIVVGGVVFVADNEVTGQGACVAKAAEEAEDLRRIGGVGRIEEDEVEGTPRAPPHRA